MATHPSANNDDPTLYFAYFGGPRDGLGMETQSGEKVEAADAEPALARDAVCEDAHVPSESDQPPSPAVIAGALIGAALSDGVFAGLYALTSRGIYVRADGRWITATDDPLFGLDGRQLIEIERSAIPLFDAVDAMGGRPTADQIVSSSTAGGPASWDTQQNPQLRAMIKRHPEPATWESRVRGLMLGLALGDAIGGAGAHVPESGVLKAGAATQLAAWTADGLLRQATYYGRFGESTHPTHITRSNQRWLLLREGESSRVEIDDGGAAYPGWLSGVPAMAEKRGHSPSMEAAIRSGVGSKADSCRPIIRALPAAAFFGAREFSRVTIISAGLSAALVNAGTHHHPNVRRTAALAARILVRCLRGPQSFFDAVREELALVAQSSDGSELETLLFADRALGMSFGCPGDPDVLRQLAPDDTSRSVVAGSIYAVASYPHWQTANTALMFARSAPDRDGVAAVTGAFLGALHGYEVFPTGPVSRLELGWVMDRLAIDMILEVKEEPAGKGWGQIGPSPEPWWDAKYPGV